MSDRAKGALLVFVLALFGVPFVLSGILAMWAIFFDIARAVLS